MELSAVWGALVRRWYLVILALGVTVAAVLMTMARVGPSYTAQGTLLLFPPVGTVRGGERVQGNPYLSLDGLDPARDILIRAMTSSTSRQKLETSHPGVGFDMYADTSVSGPIIVVDVTGSSEKDTIDALKALFDTVPRRLASLQSNLGIKRGQYITVQTLTIDRSAQVVTKGQVRAGIVAGGGVLVGSLLCIGLLDGLVLSRRRGVRRERGRDAPATEGDVGKTGRGPDARTGVEPLEPHGRAMPSRTRFPRVVPQTEQSSAARQRW